MQYSQGRFYFGYRIRQKCVSPCSRMLSGITLLPFSCFLSVFLCIVTWFKYPPQTILTMYAKSKSKCVSIIVIRVIRIFGNSRQPRSRSSRTIEIILHVLLKQLRVIYLLINEIKSAKSMTKQYWLLLWYSFAAPLTCSQRGFGGLEDACWPLVPKFAGSNTAEAVGFFRAKNSPARLPSEGK
jgi:hypothetical protein